MDLSLENVDLILFEYDSLYLKAWQFSCHLIIGRNVKDLSLESGKCFTSFCLSTKISLFQKGWQSSCHLITGRNVKDVSLENVLPHIDLVGKIIPKGVAVQLPPNNR